MIGLCRGLAHRAYHDVRRNPGAFSWKDAANFEPCFGLIASRNKVAPSVVNPKTPSLCLSDISHCSTHARFACRQLWESEVTKEALEGFRYDGWELVIDVTGGGVAGLFPRGILANVAASRLRRLADDLERNVAKRAEKETFSEPVEGVVAGSNLERQIQLARAEIATWPASVKRAMNIQG
jgi:hypothetical protein